jgi:predicted metal-dependent phosphoesterase TrpH
VKARDFKRSLVWTLLRERARSMTENLIDLHLHTTASDGRCTPADLVDRARRVGIQTLSVTDHDTMAATEAVAMCAVRVGMRFIPGIEITSVYCGRDAHVLAYQLPADAPGLQETLAHQREQRVARALEIAARLQRMGAPIDIDALLTTARQMSGKAIARPQIAEALRLAGHVVTVAEAFDRYLGEGCGAFVPHTGVGPTEIVDLITCGGGVASLAHPGTLNRDELIPELVEAGLQCLEVFHSSHDEATTARYLALAVQLRLVPTGGSDYHGEGTRRAEFFGRISLPRAEFDRFDRLLADAAIRAQANPGRASTRLDVALS